MRRFFASALLVAATAAIADAQQAKPPEPSTAHSASTAPAKDAQPKPKTPATTTASTPAATEPARAETIEQIVERVTRRLQQQKTSRPSRQPAADVPPPQPRVKLVWRPSVMWPTELVGEPRPVTPQDRVSVSWEQTGK